MRKAWVVFCLTVCVQMLCPLSAKVDTTDERTGRIYILEDNHGPYKRGTFFVYREMLPNGIAVCCPLSGTVEAKIPFRQLLSTGYTDTVSVEEINEELVYSYSSQTREKRSLFYMYRELSRALGPSDRFSMLNKFDSCSRTLYQSLVSEAQKLNQAELAMLLSERRGMDPDPTDRDDARESIIKKISPEKKTLKTVKEAAASGDIFLAVSLLKRYRMTIGKYVASKVTESRQKKKIQTENSWEIIYEEYQSAVRNVEQEICSQYVSRNSRQRKYMSRYTAMYPKARGLWSEAMPGNFIDLCGVYEKSYLSFRQMIRNSSRTNFREWGACAIDVLMLSADSTAANSLKKEFDAALMRAEKKKRISGK